MWLFKAQICSLVSLSSSLPCNFIFLKVSFRSICLVSQAISNNRHTFHSACSLSLMVTMSPTVLVCLPLTSLCLSYIFISFSMATLPIEFTIQNKYEREITVLELLIITTTREQSPNLLQLNVLQLCTGDFNKASGFCPPMMHASGLLICDAHRGKKHTVP